MKNSQRSFEDPDDYEEFFKFNVFLLRIIGLLPPEGMKPWAKLLYNIYSAALLVILSSCLILQAIAMVRMWGNVVMVSETLCVFSGVIIGFADSVFFLRKRKQIVELMKIMKSDFISKMKPKYSHIPMEAQKSLILSGKVKGFLSVMLVSFAFSTSLSHVMENDIDRDSPLKEDSWKKIPFIIWSPVDVNEISGRVIIMVYELFLSAAVLISALAVDLICLALMNQITGQFRYLIALLDNMEDEYNERKKIRPLFNEESGDCHFSLENFENDVDEEWYKNYLKDCIESHQAILKYADDLKNLVSLPVFIQIGNVPIVVCLTGFNMTLKEKTRDQALKFASLCSTAVYKLFLYCWFGQDLINFSEQVQEAVYGCSWYTRKQYFKRLLPMMIMRSSRSTSMSASVFYNLSFVTFSSFMNASYTYFTLLTQMNESE